MRKPCSNGYRFSSGMPEKLSRFFNGTSPARFMGFFKRIHSALKEPHIRAIKGERK